MQSHDELICDRGCLKLGTHSVLFQLRDDGKNKLDNEVEGNYIASINTFDPDASHFRYPCDKLMNAYYSGNEKIDYKSIGDYMEAAINYLEGVELSLEAIDWLS